jgi:cellulose synthase (UDP-forming)
MWNLQTWGPLLLTVGSMYALVQILGADSRPARAIGALLSIALAARYIWWRYAMSLPDQADQNIAQLTWTWLFLITETVAAITSISVLMWMSRWRNRSEEADRGSDSPLLAAPVDVFIATLNEPYDILERTIVSASCIDHPDLRVWVLDDGARLWVRRLAEDLGAHYVCRDNHRHAKAGNINNGLASALSSGRRPEFILLLDADFTVSRTILHRTLGLFAAADVAIVQTPQHFFNPDPIQRSLLRTKVWPDEQRFFFNYLLEAKDAWGAAFCCGTSAVLRVAALEAIGGMATETVTEDMLTTFKLKEHGYRTIFLNEQLSMGLAPEGLQEYIKQRSRWCLGSVQQIYTRWSFAGSAHIGLVNRLSCLDAVCYWMFTFPFKLMLITAPLVFWWTGTSVVNADAEDIVYWLAPAAAASMTFMATHGRNRVMPVMTDVSQLLSAFAIIGTAALAIVKPWGHPFQVTAKGRSTDGVTVHWGIAAPFVFIALATLLGMLVNLSSYSPLKVAPGYELNVFWSVCSIAVLLLAVHICVEPPRRRLDERFVTEEPALLNMPNDRTLSCVVRDLSVGGARLECSTGWTGVLAGHLTFLADGTTVPFRPLRLMAGDLTVRFDEDPCSRRLMTAKLFTGGYHNEIERVSAWSVLCTTARSLVS